MLYQGTYIPIRIGWRLSRASRTDGEISRDAAPTPQAIALLGLYRPTVRACVCSGVVYQAPV